MNGLRLIVLIIFMVFLLTIFLFVQSIREKNQVTLFITGDLQGYLIPCGCRTSPAGGLSRRLPILEKIKKENPESIVIPVELPNVYTDRNPSKDLINKTVGEFLFKNKFLVSLGERDLLLGDKLRDYYKGDYYLTGVEGFKEEEVIELGGYKKIPFGEKSRLHLMFFSEMEGKPDFPINTFREKIKNKENDVYIIFGNISPQTIEKFLNEKVQILAFFATWGNSVTSVPQKAKNSWVVFLGDKGRRYAQCDISYFEGKWTVWTETQYLNRDFSFDENEEVKINTVLKQVESENEKILSSIENKFEGKSNYSGSSYCKSCHKMEYEKWEKTGHFSATKVLEIDHQEKNPECLVCHTTGFDKGGYPNSKIDFTGVGCEECHGVGKDHPPSKMKVERGIEMCFKCHTKRDSPYFNEGYFQLIEHSSKKR